MLQERRTDTGVLGPIAVLLILVGIREMRRRKRERAVDEAADRLAAALSRFEPPGDMHDAEAWDRYWDNLFSDPMTAGMQLMSAEMFSDCRSLVKVMKNRQMTAVLCVGHGISREPAALARAGLLVTALDLSPRAAEWCQRLRVDDQSLPGLIDSDQEAPGGRIEYVTGDLTDRTVCPGPFDVIVERRTVQLFGDAKGQALDALAARLATPGILLSHCHDGAWKPPQPRVHPNEQWFRERGWTIWPAGGTSAGFADRVAWLVFTTG